jgi:hypothetical protein
MSFSLNDGSPWQLIVGQARFVKVPFIIKKNKAQSICIYKWRGKCHTEKTFLKLCVESMRLENKFINFGVRSG